MPSSKGDAKQGSASREDAINRPLEYLLTSSPASIESFHLSRMNAVANLRKELHEIFEEWVEAEVQARLAQWLLARKNPEEAAAGSSLPIDLEDRPSFRAAGDASAARISSEAAAVDSGARPAIARLVAHDPPDADAKDSSPRRTARNSVPRDFISRDSAARPAVARPTNRIASVVAAKPRSRSAITRPAIACRTPHFPAFVHPRAARAPTTISKPGKATSMLLSFRRPHRNRAAS
ncbi:MAG: hypothetical protein WCC03_17685 [Candidatus Acidiferrales bacterium]